MDTNVISELIRPKPEIFVTSWLEKTDEGLLYLSVLTPGEIRKGIAALPDAARRSLLEAWLEKDMRDRFTGRILPITEEIADRWGQMSGRVQSNKYTLPVIDGLLAATAQHYNLILVTRNVKDVTRTGVEFFNPWET